MSRCNSSILEVGGARACSGEPGTNLLANAALLTFCRVIFLPVSLTRSFVLQQKLVQSNANNPSLAGDVHDPVADGWLQGAKIRAWQELSRDGRYKWAGPSDFRFPALLKTSLDMQKYMKNPIEEGHIKGSYRTTEAALIVVDTTRSDWNRYSILIMSETKRPPVTCEIKWLFRSSDLSRVRLDWSSGETLGISKYGEDGSFRHCFVRWNAKTQKYDCALRKSH